MTGAFELLHPTVQRKLWDMKWTELRPIQFQAIEHLLAGAATDCIISSPTASGKTEAAFLPILSAIADEPTGGVRAMYIGPLKALINDQFGRLEGLCTRMDMPVHRWHGDIDEGDRKALLERPSGILLITPESLEAMFVLRASKLPAIFGKLAYVVIDETHAFIGNPRGAQLLSLLHRLRLRTGVDAKRIALSATLGDPSAAKRWLRRDGRPVALIDGGAGGSEIKLRVRGIWRQPVPEDHRDDAEDTAMGDVATSILLACRGKTNLVFANAKSMIEQLADELATRAEAMSVRDEIVVHHGSLSKEQRELAEMRLRAEQPCTAVCSNTLELGIDIGTIDEVVQVSTPWSVASLVQRLGRSGRREGSARILRAYMVEDAPSPDEQPWAGLHLDFIRGLAMIQLMLEGWLEPPEVDRANLSTMVQQVLSTLAETGGILAHDLYPRLMDCGAFAALRKAEFGALLRELAARDLIEQMSDASLVLGLKGQRIVEHYSFYAAFNAPNEFQVVHRDRTIGTLPESSLPATGEHLILAGRRWLVQDIDVDARKLYVVPSKGRRPPRFASGRPDTAPLVHARMRRILAAADVPSYLDETAAEMLSISRANARSLQINALVRVVPERTVISAWAGTRILRTLALVLQAEGVAVACAEDVALEIAGPVSNWRPTFRRFVETPDGAKLAAFAERKLYARLTDGEKFDAHLPSELWCGKYANERLDIEGAVRIARRALAEGVQLPLEPTSTIGTVRAIENITQWAAAVAALPVVGRLPSRTVLVPSEAHAHALRVELGASAPVALAGTLFFTAAAAARAVLDRAGVVYRPGEEARRPLRLRRLFRTQLALVSYIATDLGTSGWEDAFASTIEQLESAGLDPVELDRLGSPRASDLASVWRALDTDASSSWTVPRMMSEATKVLATSREAWPFDGHVFAAVPFGIDAVHAGFLQRIPNLELGIVVGRPARRRAIDRVRVLLGAPAAKALQTATAPGSRDDELGILVEHLLEPPTRLKEANRRRSHGPDGSVALEVHAGVDEELDAMARWVLDEVVHRQTPLQDIAILIPTADPLSALIADRLDSLPWGDEAPPVYLACGRPAASTSAGSRILGVARAIATYLPAESVIEILPRLRLQEQDRHLTPGLAREIVNALGTLGGSASRPEAALEWRNRLAGAKSKFVPPVAPAIEALVSLASEMLDRGGLGRLWAALHTFIDAHVLSSKASREILEQLDGRFEALAADPITADIVGVAAMELIAEEIEACRIHERRYGDPAIYVGTIVGSAGLPFAATRIIGIAESAFPRTLREDAILPSELRQELPAFAMVSDDDFATGQLHAFDQVVRATRGRLVISAPRTDLDGSEREPASLFVEVAAALGRPNAITGERGSVIPTSLELERDAFEPSRLANSSQWLETPLTAGAWLDRVATARPIDLPSAWTRSALTDPRTALERPLPLDGLLGPSKLTRAVPGSSAERALSASTLRTLLACPHRFLFEHVLGFSSRRDVVDRHRIDPLAYGKLVHRIAEKFALSHGTAFGAREETLEVWLEQAAVLARTELEAWLGDYSLDGQGTIDTERDRLCRDVHALIEHDWDHGRPRKYEAVEREFATTLPTAHGDVHVKGRIDRLDVEGTTTLLRDLKTGRAPVSELDMEDPDIDIDLQLALYALVVERLAPEWGIPNDVAAAYVYVDRLALRRERAFRDNRTVLHNHGRRWLNAAAGLLADGNYVRTPRAEDCRRCPFGPACAERAHDSEKLLADASGSLAEFWELKR